MALNEKTINVAVHLDASQYNQGINQVKAKTKESESALKQMGITGVAAGAAIALALRKVIQTLKESLELYKKQAQAELGLEAAIRGTGQSVDQLLPKYKALASEIQSLTGIGDELTLGYIQQATLIGVQSQDMEQFIMLATNMSGTVGGMTNAMKGLNQTMLGQASTLDRYIPELRTWKEEGKTVEEMMSLLTERFEGQAEVMDVGGWDRLNSAVGDYKETLGKTTNQALKPFVKGLTDILERQNEIANAIPRAINALQEYSKYLEEAGGNLENLNREQRTHLNLLKLEALETLEDLEKNTQQAIARFNIMSAQLVGAEVQGVENLNTQITHLRNQIAQETLWGHDTLELEGQLNDALERRNELGQDIYERTLEMRQAAETYVEYVNEGLTTLEKIQARHGSVFANMVADMIKQTAETAAEVAAEVVEEIISNIDPERTNAQILIWTKRLKNIEIALDLDINREGAIENLQSFINDPVIREQIRGYRELLEVGGLTGPEWTESFQMLEMYNDAQRQLLEILIQKDELTLGEMAMVNQISEALGVREETLGRIYDAHSDIIEAEETEIDNAKKLKKALEDAADMTETIFDSASELAELFGGDSQMVEGIEAIGGAVNDAMGILNAVASGAGPIGIIISAVSFIVSAIKAVKDLAEGSKEAAEEAEAAAAAAVEAEVSTRTKGLDLLKEQEKYLKLIGGDHEALIKNYNQQIYALDGILRLTEDATERQKIWNDILELRNDIENEYLAMAKDPINERLELLQAENAYLTEAGEITDDNIQKQIEAYEELLELEEDEAEQWKYKTKILQLQNSLIKDQGDLLDKNAQKLLDESQQLVINTLRQQLQAGTLVAGSGSAAAAAAGKLQAAGVQDIGSALSSIGFSQSAIRQAGGVRTTIINQQNQIMGSALSTAEQATIDIANGATGE